ncbi:MAG: hypothetical protein ISN29_08320 [Gammaproteobacteria bacterium AqS3]|nr:hypothetical protein [Gammaproteobacteria bacterium AqS3]
MGREGGFQTRTVWLVVFTLALVHVTLSGDPDIRRPRKEWKVISVERRGAGEREDG